MRHLAPVLALVACSAKQVQPDVESARDPAQQIAAPQRGRHGSAIELVALSDDGSAALSQDVRAGTRLWPSLDGTREPVVVRLAFARRIAINRAAGGFVIAGLDESGGAEIVALDAHGSVRSRTRIAPDPPIEQVVIEGERVLLLRADQLIVALDPMGRALAHIPPPPGDRIQTLATRNGRTVAVTEHAAARLDGTTWSIHAYQSLTSSDERLRQRVDTAALSPDGHTLAIDFNGLVAVVGLQTGGKLTIASQFTTPTGSLDDVIDIGFADNHTLVVNRPTVYEWSPINGEGETKRESKSMARASEMLAIGEHHLVRGAGTSLELISRDQPTRYLGYSAISPIPDVAGMKIPLHTYPITDVQRLDDTRVLVTRADSNGWKSLAVVDTRDGTYGTEFPAAVASSVQRYEPSTRLLALSDETASYLVQYDRAQHKFETWYRIEYEPSDLHVVDPNKAANAVAVAIRTDGDGKRVRAERFYREELVVGGPIAAHEIHTYAGRFYGIDRTGQVYVASGEDLHVFDRDERVLTFKGVLSAEAELEHTLRQSEVQTALDHIDDRGFDRIHAPAQTPPALSPRVVVGPYIALVDGGNVALLDFDGSEKWRVPAEVRDLRWIDGTLVGSFAGGSASFDLATGALRTRSCGWAFGFSLVPRTEGPDEESICEAR